MCRRVCMNKKKYCLHYSDPWISLMDWTFLTKARSTLSICVRNARVLDSTVGGLLVFNHDLLISSKQINFLFSILFGVRFKFSSCVKQHCQALIRVSISSCKIVLHFVKLTLSLSLIHIFKKKESQ